MTFLEKGVLFTVINNCPFTVWPGFIGRSKSIPSWPLPKNGGWELSSKKSTVFLVPQDLYACKIWARTNCTWNETVFSCETGSCRQSVQCAGSSTRQKPVTFAEFTLKSPGTGQDYYDVSLVNGYNVQITIRPGLINTEKSSQYWCVAARCTEDLSMKCPKELTKYNEAGQVIGCMSACDKFKTPQYCCLEEFNNPIMCKPSTWPVNYPAIFKSMCPTVWTYSYDDDDSTFTCKNTNYEISFC